jgi:hypothetical protein
LPFLCRQVREFYIPNEKIYLERKANLEKCEDDLSKGISEFSCVEVFDVHAIRDPAISGDLRRISDKEIAVPSFFGTFVGDITCDRSRIELKRGEVAANNPLHIVKSCVGISLYNN